MTENGSHEKAYRHFGPIRPLILTYIESYTDIIMFTQKGAQIYKPFLANTNAMNFIFSSLDWHEKRAYLGKHAMRMSLFVVTSLVW